MWLTFAGPSLAGPWTPAVRRSTGRPSSSSGELVVDQRADDGFGGDAVEVVADRPDELGAAPADEEDRELGGGAARRATRASVGRRSAPNGRPSVAVPSPAHERPDPGGERLGRPGRRRGRPGPGRSAGGRARPWPRHRRRGPRRTRAGRRIAGSAASRLTEGVHEEVVLHVGRLLAPEGAVVVEGGDPLGDRQVVGGVEEVEDRLAGGPWRARTAGPARGRSSALLVGDGVDHRAAGRSGSRCGSSRCRSSGGAGPPAGTAGSRCRRRGTSRP